jgi:ribulose-5-phosphate 4-epimerase/fuculose-1-phosphate aldolase
MLPVPAKSSENRSNLVAHFRVYRASLDPDLIIRCLSTLFGEGLGQVMAFQRSGLPAREGEHGAAGISRGMGGAAATWSLAARAEQAGGVPRWGKMT